MSTSGPDFTKLAGVGSQRNQGQSHSLPVAPPSTSHPAPTLNSTAQRLRFSSSPLIPTTSAILATSSLVSWSPGLLACSWLALGSRFLSLPLLPSHLNASSYSRLHIHNKPSPPPSLGTVMSSIFIQLAYVEKSLPFVHAKLCSEECHAGKMTQQLRTLLSLISIPSTPCPRPTK